MFIQSTKDADDAIVKYLRDVVGKFFNANAETMAYNAAKYGMDTIRPYCEWGEGIKNVRHDFYTLPAFIKQYAPATVSPEWPTAENKETQPTRVLYMDRLSYRSYIRISPSNNYSMPTILG